MYIFYFNRNTNAAKLSALTVRKWWILTSICAICSSWKRQSHRRSRPASSSLTLRLANMFLCYICVLLLLLILIIQCAQDTEISQNKDGSVWRHDVDCCCVTKVCDGCVKSKAPCENCGERKKTFLGFNALDEFCNWLFSEANKGCYALAHNCRG